MADGPSVSLALVRRSISVTTGAIERAEIRAKLLGVTLDEYADACFRVVEDDDVLRGIGERIHLGAPLVRPQGKRWPR